MDIGIDLGTTFSVIAVKGKMEMKPGQNPGKYLGDEGMDVTILPDPAGNYTIPSVFWWEPDLGAPDDHSKGTYAYGWEAKQIAEEGKAPIVFSKRSIGTNEKLMCNGRAFTAKEVARYFLGYLKTCAEEATGQTVQRVVVTHPAYFKPGQRTETLDAALEADLGITPDQMMMEPCAAALAFTINDSRGVEPGDALRVLTYDLGGGTFDVAVMEKIEGVIQMKRFGGDHLLGGSDFDKALVQWILDQLKAQGRVIPFDESNPEHVGRRSRMLQLAERIKERLSQQNGPKSRVPVKMDFLVDDKGQRAPFSGSISPLEFAGLIKNELDRTIACCRQTLAEADMTAQDLHTVLLVGGSTYGPWVQDVVSQEFGVEVQPFAPDYCVAAGAAFRVAQLPPPGPKNARLELVLKYQSTSSIPEVNISGVIRPVPGSDLTEDACRHLQVLLEAPSGEMLGPAEIGPTGNFLFKNIALNDGDTSKFSVIVSENGQKILSGEGQIEYSAERPKGGSNITIVPVLPRPLYLKADRMVPMAEEGAALPSKCELRDLRLAFGGSSLKIPIYLDSEEVGRIELSDIPEDAGEGCPVVVSVEITVNNEMRGKVQVLGANGNVVKEGPVLVVFPPIIIPDLIALSGDFEELKGQLDQEILQAPPQDRARLAGPGTLLVKKIEKIFAGEKPDRQILHERIQELRRLVHPPADDMDPPRKEFEALLAHCRDLVAEAPDNPGLKSTGAQLSKVETAGKDAAATKNQRKWATANETLRQLAGRIEKALKGGSDEKAPPPPSAAVQKAQAMRYVESLRADLRGARDRRMREAGAERWGPRCEEYAKKIDRIASDIGKIPDEAAPEQAQAQVQSYLGGYETLKKKINEIAEGTEVRT